MATKAKSDLRGLLAGCAKRVERDLARWLVEPGTPAAVAAAMRYCVLGGGKRLRPAIVYFSAEAVGGSARDERVRRCAAALELVHCYSLVHDDLPAMDDDDLRRGRPTAHVKFGEAMAILAGDALLTRAFGLLADGGAVAACALAELARGAGGAGMIAGQAADMHLCRVPAGDAGVRYIHRRKTAALIRCAARLGALAGGGTAKQRQALGDYGENLGLSFQLMDDLLDRTATAETMGKATGKDASAGKRTYRGGAAVLQRRGEALTRRALAALKPLGERARHLALLAEQLTKRTH